MLKERILLIELNNGDIGSGELHAVNSMSLRPYLCGKKFHYFAIMKSIAIVFFFLFLMAACNNSEEAKTKSDNDMDAARNFLDAALKGDYKDASAYMLKDSANLEYLNVTARGYQRLSPDERSRLKAASLRFFDTRQVNDSTTITIFANSYKNDKDTLRIIRANGRWLVDLKYLFEHDTDTSSYNQKNKIDTIQK